MKKALFHWAILPNSCLCYANDVYNEINSFSNHNRLKLIRLKLLVISTLIFISANGQSIYTPYDELPNIVKSYKPAFDKSYPEWGKKLYQYPINYNEICDEFDKYIQEENPGKSALIRYFKTWRLAIQPYALSDGTIQLPDIQKFQQDLKSAQVNANQQLKSASTENSWSFLGPKETFRLNQGSSNNAPVACPWQVNVYSIDVSKSDNNILFCGSETGCINKCEWKITFPTFSQIRIPTLRN